MKRLLDIVLATTALVLLAPLLLLAALAIALESGWPVLFQQTRLGLHGRALKMLKFRSMHHNAAATGPYFTASNDARITRVGRLIPHQHRRAAPAAERTARRHEPGRPPARCTRATRLVQRR